MMLHLGVSIGCLRHWRLLCERCYLDTVILHFRAELAVGQQARRATSGMIFFEVTHSKTKRKWQAHMIQNHICKRCAIFSTRTGIQLPQNLFCSGIAQWHGRKAYCYLQYIMLMNEHLPLIMPSTPLFTTRINWAESPLIQPRKVNPKSACD